MFDCSERVADGKEGSKKPCECSLLWPLDSPECLGGGGCSVEACRAKLGREKLFTDVVLDVACKLGYMEGREYWDC